ncbi:Kinesin light chain [Phytophthora citrophthora]|uniref:Kinesin light chain n=1 Tax=Phytophthora citrophthora TaxID=4793 RepID=A0AAD9G036_9STRA|nr:Kinesin light chain [Phytophthora citrophthora]
MEIHVQVSDDLKQLSLLFVMNGEHDKALPLLHQRLVIHEKFGPDELTAETLQELGTVYRLHGLPDIAVQHLLRALTLREKHHGKNSLKVAETLNSLALVSQIQGESQQVKAYQLRSLQILYDSAEPEDIESEDIPWEVYKRLKQQRGPSTATNSITLLKGNMRKSVMDVVYKSSGSLSPTEEPTRPDKSETLGMNEKIKLDTTPRDQMAADVDRRRVLRSHSETTMQTSRGMHASGSSSDRDRIPFTPSEIENDRLETDFDPLAQSRISLAPSRSLRSFRPRRDASAGNSVALLNTDEEISLRVSSAVPIAQSIRDFPTLQQRVETLKRRILAGYPDVNANVERLAADVDRIQARELREVGSTMVALVREMNRLCIRTDLTQQQLPVLEGMLEKKSASIFRGWEKRWFKVDPKTFILSYHFSKDDYARGFTPRGGFAVSRISNILVQRHARGNHFHFDVVVDLSTRLNPQGSRTYELRCEDEEALRYWVETLHFYKAMAQKTPPRPSTS